MDYTVDITIHTERPLTKRALLDVAQIGGVAVGEIRGRVLETTLTIAETSDWRQALSLAAERITALTPGTVVSASVMTSEEADRRSKPKLLGVTEIAKILKVSRQRVSTLSRHPDFPAPAQRLSTGPVWSGSDISAFAARWQRKSGRPKKQQPEGRRES